MFYSIFINSPVEKNCTYTGSFTKPKLLKIESKSILHYQNCSILYKINQNY